MSTGSLPLTSVVFPSDPRVLPIVYDSPDCRDVNTPSLLECPTSASTGEMVFTNDGVSGRLGFSRVIGERALVGVVGVACESKQYNNM